MPDTDIRLLQSQKQGGIKRERDVRQPDIQYTDSPLTHSLLSRLPNKVSSSERGRH
ncbi:hypothetical protein AH333_002138 [Salmonella enterica subsp. salamae]|nr:hypothetical protein [Salmonella enterica subsp. salamae]